MRRGEVSPSAALRSHLPLRTGPQTPARNAPAFKSIFSGPDLFRGNAPIHKDHKKFLQNITLEHTILRINLQTILFVFLLEILLNKIQKISLSNLAVSTDSRQ